MSGTASERWCSCVITHDLNSVDSSVIERTIKRRVWNLFKLPCKKLLMVIENTADCAIANSLHGRISVRVQTLECRLFICK